MSIEVLQIEISEYTQIGLVYIKGGQFLMGSDEDGNTPVHEVLLGDFWMAKYQVNQAIWEEIVGDNPSNFKGKHRPVEQVSWDEVQAFIRKLNQRTGKLFRLPTESEWEFAARGAEYSQGYLYAGSDKLSQVGWYRENSNNRLVLFNNQ